MRTVCAMKTTKGTNLYLDEAVVDEAKAILAGRRRKVSLSAYVEAYLLRLIAKARRAQAQQGASR